MFQLRKPTPAKPIPDGFVSLGKGEASYGQRRLDGFAFGPDPGRQRTSARLIVLAEDGSRAPDTLTLSEIREICRALLRALGVG